MIPFCLRRELFSRGGEYLPVFCLGGSGVFSRVLFEGGVFSLVLMRGLVFFLVLFDGWRIFTSILWVGEKYFPLFCLYEMGVFSPFLSKGGGGESPLVLCEEYLY